MNNWDVVILTLLELMHHDEKLIQNCVLSSIIDLIRISKSCLFEVFITYEFKNYLLYDSSSWLCFSIKHYCYYFWLEASFLFISYLEASAFFIYDTICYGGTISMRFWQSQILMIHAQYAPRALVVMFINYNEWKIMSIGELNYFLLKRYKNKTI